MPVYVYTILILIWNGLQAYKQVKFLSCLDCLSPTHTRAHTYTLSLVHTHTHSLSFIHTHSESLSLPLIYTCASMYTHTHTLTYFNFACNCMKHHSFNCECL